MTAGQSGTELELVPDGGWKPRPPGPGPDPDGNPDGGLVQDMQRCWEDLAQAVILQAVADYREARETLRSRPGRKEAQELLRECESFFTSLWFAHLNNADGKKLLRRLREEV